jgi:sulfopyruvate decarboxylase subunit beta
LGLALARPERRVIVCNGDGSMLMNLGSLASIVNAAPKNLVVIVFDNGAYEVTGAQPVPGAGVVDYAAVARGCGFTSVFQFAELGEWNDHARAIIAAEGPTFVWLEIEPVYGLPGPKSPGPAKERARKFMQALSS